VTLVTFLKAPVNDSVDVSGLELNPNFWCNISFHVQNS